MVARATQELVMVVVAAVVVTQVMMPLCDGDCLINSVAVDFPQGTTCMSGRYNTIPHKIVTREAGNT
jgi:hypothetical protein